MQLNINTTAVVAFTNTLEKLHRSALPSAIRDALNSAVYDVKTKTLLKNSDEKFTNRQPNFFKANSRFENAKGFNVNTMKATVGFVSTGLKGNNNFAVKDLEQQEKGGTIKRRSYVAMKTARSGNSPLKNVRASARLSNIRKIVDSKKMSGRHDREKFRKSVHVAGVGGYVLGNRNPAILWRVNSLRRTGSLPFKLTPLYTFKQNRSVSVQPTNFMKTSSLQSGAKIEIFYIEKAKRQMAKFPNWVNK